MSKKGPLLNDHELANPSVAKIMQYFDEKLAKLRIANDSFDAEPSVRGEIAGIKAFQKAVYPKQQKEIKEIKTTL